MPYIDIRVSKQVDAQTKNVLQKEIAANMTIIPGKTASNTVICIFDSCSMYVDYEADERAFIDVRLFQSSPEESKFKFSEKLFTLFEEILKIPPNKVTINFIELPNWASNGSYK